MSRSKSLYNSDLAPTPSNKKNWGWFEIFNVWANDVQSLFIYLDAYSIALTPIWGFELWPASPPKWTVYSFIPLW